MPPVPFPYEPEQLSEDYPTLTNEGKIVEAATTHLSLIQGRRCRDPLPNYHCRRAEPQCRHPSFPRHLRRIR